ncbi:MAG: GNAT family N-acetyltransferase [Gammaproteobacteria bacterium]|nr:GNAT family N-acetyltransferase [Gammaproteobacteria bacterium]
MSRTLDVRLRDETPVRIRPIIPEDGPRLAEGLKELSPRSRYLRFLRSVDTLSNQELTYLTNVDYDTHFAWVAFDVSTPQPRGIGVGRYAQFEPGAAEAAVVVLDRYQHRGLGGILLRLVAETASEHGIRRFRAWVSPQNAVVMQALEQWDIDRRLEEGAVVVDIPLPLPSTPLEDSPLYRTLRAAARGELRVHPHATQDPSDAFGEFDDGGDQDPRPA